MNLQQVNDLVLTPGLSLLPEKMDTPESRLMLMCIGLQESRFKYRKQIGGPARSFYQFEKGGGVKGVLNHRATKPYIEEILRILEVKNTPSEVYKVMAYNDALATVMARLLLWTVNAPMPNFTDDSGALWDYYIEGWRPGKPHRHTFDGFRLQASEFLSTVY